MCFVDLIYIYKYFIKSIFIFCKYFFLSLLVSAALLQGLEALLSLLAVQLCATPFCKGCPFARDSAFCPFARGSALYPFARGSVRPSGLVLLQGIPFCKGLLSSIRLAKLCSHLLCFCLLDSLFFRSFHDLITDKLMLRAPCGSSCPFLPEGSLLCRSF